MKNISSVAIAFTYVGTIVGAGFASGQELKKYFVDFGVYGVFGLILASFLFFYLGKKIMTLCLENNIGTYDKLLNLLSNKFIARVFDFFITLFLIGTLTTMNAGMGTILNEVFDIPMWVGSLILIVLTVFVVKKGISEISNLNVLIVPILIFVTIIVSLTSFGGFENVKIIQNNDIVTAMTSSVLYVAYNIVMALSILPALAISSSNQAIQKGTMWAGMIIGSLGFLIFVALFTNYDIIQNVEIPLAALSNKYIGFYMITFLLEVFSTAVSSLYGVYTRINKNNTILYIIALFSYVFSLVGFSNLIKYLYGVMGVIGVFMVAVLLKRGEYR